MPPLRLRPLPAAAPKGSPPIPSNTLDDVIQRFGRPVDGETDRQRTMRQSAGGLALVWLGACEDCPEISMAIRALEEAAKLACAACP